MKTLGFIIWFYILTYEHTALVLLVNVKCIYCYRSYGNYFLLFAFFEWR